MTDELLLVGRGRARTVLETHADRLRERGVAERVGIARYDDDPAELAWPSGGRGDTRYVVPLAAAHDRDTTSRVPAALPDAYHCEPVGTCRAVTGALADRAREEVTAGEDATLALVAFGDTSRPYQRRATETHAARLRETTAYGEVVTAYLLQNPAAECVRYNVTGDRGVVVPFFVTECEATVEAIPEKLELDRGGLAYADPLGAHPAVTDAVAAEVAKARALGGRTAPVRPVATDGGAADASRQRGLLARTDHTDP